MSSNEWAHFQQQTVDQRQSPLLSSIIYTTSTTETDDYVVKVASSTDHVYETETLSSRPIKRRLRASKRTPTTLLNADASNFRALVQQFTGRPINAPKKASRSPLNINFARGREECQQVLDAHSTPPVPFNWDRSTCSSKHQQQNNAQPQLYQQQEQPSMSIIPNKRQHESSSTHTKHFEATSDLELFMPHDLAMDELSWGSPPLNNNVNVNDRILLKNMH